VARLNAKQPELGLCTPRPPKIGMLLAFVAALLSTKVKDPGDYGKGCG
jgi:hypothetical protein